MPDVVVPDVVVPDVVDVPDATADDAAGPAGPAVPYASRRERREAERRQADRRSGDPAAWTGPERRVGERRAALRAERGGPDVPVDAPAPVPSGVPAPLPASAPLPPPAPAWTAPQPLAPPRPLPDPAVLRTAREPVRTAALRAVLQRPLVGLLGGVLVIALVVAAAALWVQRAATVPPAPVAAAGDAGTVLVGVVGAEGLTSVAVLGADDGAAVGLLLPGDVVTGRGTLADTATSAVPGVVSQALGLRLDGAWFLTTAGLAGLVDAAGGVRVDVDRSVRAGGVQVPEGPGRLTGAQAAAYATYRAEGEPAEARLSRVQAVLAGVVAGLPTSPDRLAAALDALGPESAPTVPVPRLAGLLLAVRDAAGTAPLAGTVVPLLPVAGADGEVAGRAVDGLEARALTRRLLPGAATAGSAVPRVAVADSTGRAGLVDAAAARLRAAGLGTPDPAQAGPSAVAVPEAVTTVRVAGSGEAARAAGARVAEALGLPVGAVRPGTATDGHDVLVVLGEDFAADVAADGV